MTKVIVFSPQHLRAPFAEWQELLGGAPARIPTLMLPIGQTPEPLAVRKLTANIKQEHQWK